MIVKKNEAKTETKVIVLEEETFDLQLTKKEMEYLVYLAGEASLAPRTS